MQQLLIPFILSALLAAARVQGYNASYPDDYCNINHRANAEKLYKIAVELNSVLLDLYAEIDCEKPGRQNNPIKSCKDLPKHSPSGDYWIQPDCNVEPFTAYCDNSGKCDEDTGNGAWMRIASLDMTNQNDTCPTGFKAINQSSYPTRLCGRQNNFCESVKFSVRGVPYSRVCGRVKAFQKASPDGFITDSDVISGPYIDGVSITKGTPREHIWTFAAMWRNNYCPCTSVGQENLESYVPDFVGNDFFCETGHRDNWERVLYDDPLWDGIDCDLSGDCCKEREYFSKELAAPSMEDIELRLCGDQGISDEDVPIESYEIYVQ